MAEQVTLTRQMVLGITDGFRYIGFQPPLTDEELDDLVVPVGYPGDDGSFHPYQQIHADGSMQIGIDADWFYEPDEVPLHTPDESLFVQYAEQVATRLGGVSLDTAVHYLGPGSMFSEANRTD